MVPAYHTNTMPLCSYHRPVHAVAVSREPVVKTFESDLNAAQAFNEWNVSVANLLVLRGSDTAAADTREFKDGTMYAPWCEVSSDIYQKWVA